MNFALTTLSVFIFILPGLVFRKFYFSGVFAKEFFTQSFYELFLSTFLPSLALHVLWVWFASWFGFHIRFDLIGKLLIAKESAIDTFINLQEYYWYIILYHSTIILAGVVTGTLAKSIIRTTKFDRIYRIFRFKNHWHYIFTGEIYEYKENAFELEKNKVRDIEFIFIDSLVETSEGTVIYDGILSDWTLSKSGGLELIYLQDVQRRYLRNDEYNEDKLKDLKLSKKQRKKLKKVKGNKYYNIPGQVFIIPYSRILNLNISYYALKYEEKKKMFRIKEVK